MAEAVYGLGVGLEVLGLVVAAFGIHATWRANAEGEPFTRPVADGVRRASWWLNAKVVPRRWRRAHHVHVAGGVIAVTATIGGSVTVDRAPLTTDLSTEDSLAALDAHIRELERAFQAAKSETHARLRELVAQGEALDGRVDQVDTQVQETARTLRVEGLRGQAVGLGLLALGLGLQTMGQLLM